MKIISTYFEVNEDGIYTRLADVFRHSIRKNMPGTDIELIRLPNPVIEGKRHQQQLIKQRAWAELAQKQTDEYIMMDCDIVVVGDLSEAFAEKFDVGYTTHNQEIKPLNGGVLFCRPTARTNNFWDRWLYMCERMYDDKELWATWNAKYKGFAQVAFGAVLESGIDCKFKKFPCLEWNACDEEWEHTNEKTKAYHIKGRLRKSIFHAHDTKSKRVYDIWKKYEKECYGSN